MFNNFTQYVRRLLQPDSKDSIKSLAMFLCVIIMCVLSLGVLGCIIYEVHLSGHIVTSLIDYGVFEVMLGGMVLGGSLPKMITDNTKIKNGQLGQIIDTAQDTMESFGLDCGDDDEVEEKPKKRKK